MKDSVRGMLLVASDIAPEDQHDFNKWYDQEHVEERVRMPGVISAARYIAVADAPQYLALYWAESLEVFSGPAYTQAFIHQTPWSLQTLPKMRSPLRRIGTVHAHAGMGSGGWVGTLPLAEGVDIESLAARCTALAEQLADDISFVQSYVIQPVDALSKPLPLEDLAARKMQPLLIIESRTHESNQSAMERAAQWLEVDISRSARYQLAWKLSAAELR